PNSTRQTARSSSRPKRKEAREVTERLKIGKICRLSSVPYIPEALYDIKVIENSSTFHNRNPFYFLVHPDKISLQRLNVGRIGVHRERVEPARIDFWRPVLEGQGGFADEIPGEDLVAVIAVKRKNGGDVVTVQSEKKHLFSLGIFKVLRLLSDLLCQLLPAGRKPEGGNSRYRDGQVINRNDIHDRQNTKPANQHISCYEL